MKRTTNHMNGKIISVIAMYAATCVAAAYMLTLIPNVEFFTMMVFLGGLLFGKATGMANGFLAALLYFVFNIYGASPLPLLAVQLGAYTLLGLAGGSCKDARFFAPVTTRSQVLLGFGGAGFVLGYTLVADLVFSIVMGIKYVAWILQGLPFTLLLVASNAITFSLLLPLVLVPVRKQVNMLYPSITGGTSTTIDS